MRVLHWGVARDQRRGALLSWSSVCGLDRRWVEGELWAKWQDETDFGVGKTDPAMKNYG